MIMIETNNTDKDETKQKVINKRKSSSIHVEKRINNKSGEKKETSCSLFEIE